MIYPKTQYSEKYVTFKKSFNNLDVTVNEIIINIYLKIDKQDKFDTYKLFSF